LWYTFELADFTVSLLLGRKYRPYFFYGLSFKNTFRVSTPFYGAFFSHRGDVDINVLLTFFILLLWVLIFLSRACIWPYVLPQRYLFISLSSVQINFRKVSKLRRSPLDFPKVKSQRIFFMKRMVAIYSYLLMLLRNMRDE
jgi:hypothetical protein